MERRLAAIFAADVVGYSALMGADETGTFSRLKSLRKDLVQPRIIEHKGRIVKLMGDGLLAEFPSVVKAVECAIQIQREIREREPEISEDKRISLRIGVNLGDLILEDGDIYGDGVNVAARLQEIAAPGGIALGASAYEHASANIDADFADGGECNLKNIAKPVRVYHWSDGRSPDRDHPFRSSGPISISARPSIAVLPFANISGDSDQEYFSDGITEDIIIELNRFDTLFVIARNSAFAFKG
ncbi:MAG: adenylate/guanylate cyclase domain-containing protein, partial [Kiloniellales bacterium]|nr:adenylate/guanylate cyclase domain-containing protein [Kiloniellales bacterium]